MPGSGAFTISVLPSQNTPGGLRWMVTWPGKRRARSSRYSLVPSMLRPSRWMSSVTLPPCATLQAVSWRNAATPSTTCQCQRKGSFASIVSW